ncbi:TPA: hypothetical protein ACKJ7R_002170, partial [Neisseria gonorrhoeae]
FQKENKSVEYASVQNAANRLYRLADILSTTRAKIYPQKGGRNPQAIGQSSCKVSILIDKSGKLECNSRFNYLPILF